MKAQLKLKHRLVYYAGIGSAAAGTHLSIVFLLVNFAHMHALVANIFAFFTAFNVSFFGHKYLTFSQLHDQKVLSLPHFFLVAASAGAINEGLYFLVLRCTHLNYLFALGLVLFLVSVYSFLLSRYWACR
ncbi:MAG: GtrA family protein [Legionella sp.]|uniref:GtrA family protein n=1 Tax=Legionella sp. TaxID=459 RepID=UPI0028423AE3|nr:GtrA family protein [Legionella sp.]